MGVAGFFKNVSRFEFAAYAHQKNVFVKILSGDESFKLSARVCSTSNGREKYNKSSSDCDQVCAWLSSVRFRKLSGSVQTEMFWPCLSHKLFSVEGKEGKVI